MVLPSPQLQFFLLGAADTPLAHLPVAGNLRLRETSVLAENEVETHPGHDQDEDGGGKEEYFHFASAARPEHL